MMLAGLFRPLARMVRVAAWPEAGQGAPLNAIAPPKVSLRSQDRAVEPGRGPPVENVRKFFAIAGRLHD
jgi:hypothetical protein